MLGAVTSHCVLSDAIEKAISPSNFLTSIDAKFQNLHTRRGRGLGLRVYFGERGLGLGLDSTTRVSGSKSGVKMRKAYLQQGAAKDIVRSIMTPFFQFLQASGADGCMPPPPQPGPPRPQ